MLLLFFAKIHVSIMQRIVSVIHTTFGGRKMGILVTLLGIILVAILIIVLAVIGTVAFGFFKLGSSSRDKKAKDKDFEEFMHEAYEAYKESKKES